MMTMTTHSNGQTDRDFILLLKLFELSDRICRGPLTPIFCRIVLRVWIKKNIVLQSSFSKISTYSLFLLGIYFFFSLPTLCYYVAGKKTFSSKEIKHVQQPLLRYSTKNNLLEKIYRCHPCYVLEFGMASRQLQTTKNVIGSPIIRYT